MIEATPSLSHTNSVFTPHSPQFTTPMHALSHTTPHHSKPSSPHQVTPHQAFSLTYWTVWISPGPCPLSIPLTVTLALVITIKHKPSSTGVNYFSDSSRFVGYICPHRAMGGTLLHGQTLCCDTLSNDLDELDKLGDRHEKGRITGMHKSLTATPRRDDGVVEWQGATHLSQ